MTSPLPLLVSSCFNSFYHVFIIMILQQTNSDLHGDIKNKQDSQDTVEDESACRELSLDLFGGASGDNACRHVLVPEKFMIDICNIIIHDTVKTAEH